MKNIICLASLLALTSLITSCGGGGGGSTLGTYSTPSITGANFVSALSSVDSAPSSLIYDESLTYRSSLAGEDDWIVIWDALRGYPIAVNLDYLRNLTYLDTMSSSFGTADEWRYEERLDRADGLFEGDIGGDIYERVDLYSDGYYYGRESSMAYEDEVETTDVNLLSAESEEIKFEKKVS